MCSVSIPSARAQAGCSKKHSTAAKRAPVETSVRLPKFIKPNLLRKRNGASLSRRVAQNRGDKNVAAATKNFRMMTFGKRREGPQRLPRPRQVTAGAGQNASRLLACRAGVHIDLHAYRHFDDLWSFPSHLGLLSTGAKRSHQREPKTDGGLAQESRSRTSRGGAMLL